MSITKKFIYLLAVALSVIYLIWRLGFTIPWHAPLFTLIFALLLVGSEVMSKFNRFHFDLFSDASR